MMGDSRSRKSSFQPSISMALSITSQRLVLLFIHTVTLSRNRYLCPFAEPQKSCLMVWTTDKLRAQGVPG